MSRYSVGRSIAKEIVRRDKRRRTYRQIQGDAAVRPGSRLVETPYGNIWMSPIESKLYDAMVKEGLSPEPQFCIKGYFVDFAFKDVNVVVEADGVTYHNEYNNARDRKRRAILIQAGWHVMCFKGTTIHDRAANCAHVIKKEVEKRGGHVVSTPFNRSGPYSLPHQSAQSYPHGFAVPKVFCAYCGDKLAAHANFCSNCGREVV